LLNKRTERLTEAQQALARGHWHKALALCDELDADSRNFPGVSEVRRQAQVEGERQEREERERLAREKRERRDAARRRAVEMAAAADQARRAEASRRQSRRKRRVAAVAAAVLVGLAVWAGSEVRFLSRKAAFSATAGSGKVEAALQIAPLIVKRHRPAAEFLATFARADAARAGMEKQREAAQAASAGTEAVELFAAAAGLGESAAVAFRQGDLAEAAKQWDSASATYAKSAALATERIEARRLVSVAVAARTGGDWGGMRAAAEGALAINAGCEPAKTLLLESQVEMAVAVMLAAKRQGDWSAARRSAGLVLSLRPSEERAKALLAELERELAAAVAAVVDALASGRSFTVPDLGMDLVGIAPGSFRMGSYSGPEQETPKHRVRISRKFWMGKYEVTQAEYEGFTGTNPSQVKDARNPVDSVTWNDAVAFCEKLTERERAGGRLPAGYEYRLPTEAEWEYVARGGYESRVYHTYSGSHTPDEVAWYHANSGNERLSDSEWDANSVSINKCRAHPVGLKKPNELGLHDMSGNAFEWCLDWFEARYYAKSPTTDPVNLQPTVERVFRGGSWCDLAFGVRSANRRGCNPGSAYRNLGFRACLAPQLHGK
jgi:formylglycine-generating enzyme required for sulfatase activity